MNGRLRRVLDRAADPTLALVLGVGYCLWLLTTVYDLGYARDEGFYFQAADSYLQWFKVLLDEPARALDQAVVDRYWKVNHEHPAFIKSLFAWSRWWLHDELGWFEERGTSYRFVGMLLSSAAVAVTYLWGRRALSAHGAMTSRMAGVVAAASFALMPRVFYHSHLDCFDMPVLAMWLITSYAYWRGLARNTWSWAVGMGLLYGLLLNTKHNSWLLPFALLAHLLYWRGPEIVEALRSRRFGRALGYVPRALWLMAVLGPVVFYLTWPWIWDDTIERLRQYVIFHTKHVYYNMEFLGRTYFAPPFPRTYAPLMTAATVPAITLALALAGVMIACVQAWQSVKQRWSDTASGFWKTLSRQHTDPARRQQLSTHGLWLLCIGVSYAPWLSNSSPIFGGTKHWMTAYPFLALFGAEAFVHIIKLARSSIGARWWRNGPLPEVLLATSVLLAPLAITAHSHPWGLSTYTPLVGGSPGGATLGLNRSFWGYTTGAVQDDINEHAARKAKVFIHDTALASWQMMARDGRLRQDLNPRLGVAYSALGVYHHEQHMSRVEHQMWTEYGTVRPFRVAGPDGVPVIWLYERPGDRDK